MWKKGNHETVAGTVPGGPLAALVRAHTTARAWVMRTPLGVAVLPEVHSTMARSVGARSVGGTRSARGPGASGGSLAQSNLGPAPGPSKSR